MGVNLYIEEINTQSQQKPSDCKKKNTCNKNSELWSASRWTSGATTPVATTPTAAPKTPGTATAREFYPQAITVIIITVSCVNGIIGIPNPALIT